ncbi:MAG TPA: MMPL family transporter, partial [Thermoleophilaceae bacterium]
MSTPTRTSSRFVRLARICGAHRWRTFLVALAALIALQGIAAAVGTKKISNFRLPGTESQRAYDLLADHFPAQKGDTDQIVFRARGGKLTDPAIKARIEASLKRVRAEKDVGTVVSPFSPSGQVTKDGRIGIALLNYSKSTNDIDPPDLEKVENAVFTARSPALQVEHGGPGAEIVRYTNSQGPSEGIGVLAAAVVLLLTFGSAVAAALPLIATLLALGSSLAVITLLSHVVDTPDFAAQLSLLIGLGVGIDYALFVVTRFRSEVR